MAQTSKQERGLEPRYEVHKIEDPKAKHFNCDFFVLDPQHDPIARVALQAYAQEARVQGYGALANDLFDWLTRLTMEVRNGNPKR